MFVKRYQLPGLTTRRWLRTRPALGPIPNHPPLHSNNSAFLRNAEILFYLARGYEHRRQTFHSSISNLSLNLNSKAHVWDWTMKLCLPNHDRVNNHTVYTLIQSYITYITYYCAFHTFHTIIPHIHYIQSYITYISYYLILRYNHTLHTLHIIMHYIHYIKL